MWGLSLVVASGGLLFIAVRGPLTIVASPVAEHRLQTCRLSNCGSRAQLLRSMWDLPRPGLEPVSPALAGRFPTTAPPGKPVKTLFVFFQLLTSTKGNPASYLWQYGLVWSIFVVYINGLIQFMLLCLISFVQYHVCEIYLYCVMLLWIVCAYICCV